MQIELSFLFAFVLSLKASGMIRFSVEAAKAEKAVNEVEVSVFDNCQAVIQAGSRLFFFFLLLFSS